MKIASDETTHVDDIDVQAGRRIGGRVQALNGRPIADALIFVPGSMLASIHTDQNGKFELEIDADAELLQVYSPDFSVSVSEAIPERWASDENDMLIDLPVLPRGMFEARVIGLPDRKPVSRGVIRIRSLHGEAPGAPGRNVSARVVDMPGGRLFEDWIPVGRSELTLHCQGFVPFTVEIEVDRRIRPESREILLEPGATVFGRVVDDQGVPIAGAAVYLGRETDIFERGFQAQCTSGSDGHFEVRGVGADSNTLVVSATGYGVVETELSIPADLLRTTDDPRQVVLRQASRIRVRVRTRDDEPVDGVVVLFKRMRPVRQAKLAPSS